MRGKRADATQPPPQTAPDETQTPPGEVAAEQPEPAAKKKDNGADKVALTPEQEFALLCQWRREFETSRDALSAAQTTLNSAKMSHKALGKKIAAECGTDAVERIKELIALDTDEQGEDKLLKRIQQLQWVAQWGNAFKGQQLELYADLRPIDEQAFAVGRLDGLAGKAFSPKYGQGTLAYQKYSEGWEKGQDVLAKGFKMLDKPPEDIGDPAAPAEVIAEDGATEPAAASG